MPQEPQDLDQGCTWIKFSDPSKMFQGPQHCGGSWVALFGGCQKQTFRALGCREGTARTLWGRGDVAVDTSGANHWGAVPAGSQPHPCQTFSLLRPTGMSRDLGLKRNMGWLPCDAGDEKGCQGSQWQEGDNFLSERKGGLKDSHTLSILGPLPHPVLHPTDLPPGTHRDHSPRP